MYNSKKGKRLYKFLVEKEQLFEQYLYDLQLQVNEIGIHDIRVVIKRLKAIFQLIELLDSDFKATKKFSPLKKLFKPAGSLREIHVNQNTLFKFCSECSIAELYINRSKSIIIDSNEQFKLALQNFNIKKQQKTLKEIKQIAKELSGKELKLKAIAYIEKKLIFIHTIVQHERTEDNVHEIRIALKKISTIILLLSHLKLDLFKEELILIFKKSEDEIGHWHDMVRLRDSIHHLPVETAIEKQELEKLLFTIARKNERFIQNIETTIQPPLSELKAALAILSNKV